MPGAEAAPGIGSYDRREQLQLRSAHVSRLARRSAATFKPAGVAKPAPVMLRFIAPQKLCAGDQGRRFSALSSQRHNNSCPLRRQPGLRCRKKDISGFGRRLSSMPANSSFKAALTAVSRSSSRLRTVLRAKGAPACLVHQHTHALGRFAESTSDQYSSAKAAM